MKKIILILMLVLNMMPTSYGRDAILTCVLGLQQKLTMLVEEVGIGLDQLNMVAPEKLNEAIAKIDALDAKSITLEKLTKIIKDTIEEAVKAKAAPAINPLGEMAALKKERSLALFTLFYKYLDKKFTQAPESPDFLENKFKEEIDKIAIETIPEEQWHAIMFESQNPRTSSWDPVQKPRDQWTVAELMCVAPSNTSALAVLIDRVQSVVPIVKK